MSLPGVKQWCIAVVLLMALSMSVHAAPGEDAVEELQRLRGQVQELYKQVRYKEAMPLALQAVQVSEKKFGARHAETASSLDALAQLYRAMGTYARAEPLYLRALAIREKVRGPMHPETAELLLHLGNLYFQTGVYAKAEAIYRRALEINQKVLGAEHPKTASLLGNLANVYYTTGAYAQAEPLYRQVLAIYEKAYGPEDARTADALQNVGLTYYVTGAYAKVEPLYQRVLAIHEKVLGPEHPDVAESLNNLAVVYSILGAYAKAEPLHQRALAIRQKVLGPEHPRIGDSLVSLGLLYARTGAYAKAEPLYQRALAIFEKAMGPEHPLVCNALENLANLYDETGAYAKAEPLKQRALTIRQNALGSEHPDVGDSLIDLADVYFKSKDYARAEPLYQRALAIFAKALGAENPQVATALNRLGVLYSETGSDAKAEPLHQRALAVYEKTLGAEHPRTGETLSHLADLYHDAGDYAKAEPLLQRASAIYEETSGPQHPSKAGALVKLANLYSASGAYAKAESLYQQAQRIQARNSERFLLTGSEYRKRAYLNEAAKDTHRNVAFSVAVRSRGSVALGLTSVLQYKGRVLDEVSGSVARLRQSTKPADREIFEQLAQVATQFSTLTYQGLGKLSPEQYRQRLDELSQRQEALEAELATRSVEFRQQVTPVTVAAVSRAIPDDAVLVELFRYRPFDPKVTGSKATQGSPRYVAYVLKADGEPDIVEIGDAQLIEAMVRDFLQALQDPARSDVKERARSLSAKIIEPLREPLRGAARVLISPDGILNLVPMAALLDENGQYLVQRFEITYLTSGRDVLRVGPVSGSQAGTVVIADPDYGMPKQVLAVAEPAGTEAQRSTDMDRSGIVFRRLPNTAVEAQAIKSLLKVGDSNVLVGLDATESNLKQVHGPRILHLASHGFFLNDQGGLGLERGPAASPRESPLLRAGIALEGANARRSGANDDGILTALEAAQLDLQGTELVVLSACESGLGQVQNGEGVYGLRRAFFIAGAQTQITSLWRVADRATGTLMVDYYQRLLKGAGRSAALREAQQAMLAKRQRSHPYYWAGFVPIGDWSPLTAVR